MHIGDSRVTLITTVEFGIQCRRSCFGGHFVIPERINKVAYHIAFLPQLSNMHNVLHVFMLLRYEPDPSHVLTQEEIPIRDDFTYVEKAILILDNGENVLKNKVSLVKVLWKIHTIEEAT